MTIKYVILDNVCSNVQIVNFYYSAKSPCYSNVDLNAVSRSGTS